MSAKKTQLSMQRSSSRRSSVVLKTRTDNLDEILNEIGGCSHYQIRRNLLFFLISIPFACQTLIGVFAGQIPGICLETGPHQCEKVDILDRQKICQYSSRRQINFLEAKKFSIISEFDLICNGGYQEPLAASLFFVGAFIGTIVIGWIAESFGRKPVMFCCMAIVSFITTLSAFADSLWFFLMARALTGFFLSGIAVSLYIIASEIIGVSYRTKFDVFIWNYFSLGLMLLVMKAYFIKNWRYLQLATTLPYLSVLICFRFVPESLRWLWRTGHYNRANKTVSTIATENNRSQALAMFPDVLSIESDEEKINCLRVLKHSRLLFYFTVLSYITFVTGLLYYSFFLVSDYLSGNAYVDFLLLAVIEIPANLFAMLLIQRIGRRKTVGLGLMLGSIFCGTLSVLVKNRSNDWRSATLAVAILSKLFLTTSNVTLVIWTRELHFLMGRSHHTDVMNSFRPLGGAVAPWMTSFIIHQKPWLPFAMMCALSVVAGLISFVLPETRDMRSRYDDDDDEEEEEEDGAFDKGSNGDQGYKSANGTVDSYLNETAETMSSGVNNNNGTKLVDIKFEYVSLSQLDRETDI